MKQNELATNRKAYFNYEILETFEAGIVLTGTEVKSLRNHGGSIQEAYLTIKRDELWLINASITPYKFGNIQNHEERRDRKLLVHKREIDRLKRKSQEKGIAMIPLSLYLKKGKIKIKIALAKGKKKYEKRAKIKEREYKKIIQKALKRF